MKCTEFVRELENNLPEEGKLRALGYADDEILEIRNSYILPPKNNSINLYSEMMDFGELVSRYEIGKLHVGVIEFFEYPVKKNERFIIGKVEVDNFVYSVKDSLFFVTDGEKELWRVANFPQNLLSALLNMMEYFGKAMLDESLYGDYKILESYARRSAELAGGDPFINFYRMLLGI